eukprot:3655700-Ditylum_brightwellii.AAC.1
MAVQHTGDENRNDTLDEEIRGESDEDVQHTRDENRNYRLDEEIDGESDEDVGKDMNDIMIS